MRILFDKQINSCQYKQITSSFGMHMISPPHSITKTKLFGQPALLPAVKRQDSPSWQWLLAALSSEVQRLLENLLLRYYSGVSLISYVRAALVTSLLQEVTRRQLASFQPGDLFVPFSNDRAWPHSLGLLRSSYIQSACKLSTNCNQNTYLDNYALSQGIGLRLSPARWRLIPPMILCY